MSFINENKKEINCKIVFYGPPRSGKSTTLRSIYDEVNRGSKGEMISLSRDDDRTLFFDFLPLNLGKVKNYTIRLHLYTVPGQIGYQQSRSLISKGVDGMVYIADSELPMMENNIHCLADLKEILENEDHNWGDIPVVFQYNKRDLKNVIPVTDLNHYLNPEGAPSFETIAINGNGIFDVFKRISADVLKSLRESV